MAKKIKFNKTDIAVAEHAGNLLFNRTNISTALDYSGTIAANKTAVPFVLGTQHFYQLSELRESLNNIQGDRKTAVAGLMRTIWEAYPQLTTGATQNKLDSLKGVAKDWAVSSVELETAEDILKEAKIREGELFTKLQQERT